MAASVRRAPACALVLCLLGVLAAALSALADAPGGRGLALVATVDGAIGPATVKQVDDVIAAAAAREARLLVIRLDTPGGLSESMRDIVQAMLAAPVPVAVHVAPAGARAASAGTYMLLAAHVAAMAPGTNVGAATPVRLGGGLPIPGRDDPPEDGDGTAKPPADAMERKLVNDAVAYIRGLADLRGRNREWAETAVREGASLPATEAVALGVADFLADNTGAVLAQADGRTVTVAGRAVTLATAGLAVEAIEPSLQVRLLAILTNPNVAFLLMMAGFYGLVLEFATPGSIGPGVVGVIALVLGLYALNMLPLDYTGLALVILGIAFMVAEAVTPAFGVLGIGGLVAFAFGASILLDSPTPAFRLHWGTIAGAAAVSGAVFVLLVGYAWRASRRPVVTGEAELIGRTATVLEWSDGTGFVHVHGETWQARSAAALAPGDRVTVRRRDGLTLDVAPDPSEPRGGPA